MGPNGKHMTAAKGRKPVTKAGGSKGSRVSRIADTGKESVELLFDEITTRMNALSDDDPGDAGQDFDYGGVIGLLDQVLAIEPGSRKGLNYKGIMLMGMGEQAKALECFNAILKTNPGDSEALNNKAIALYGLGKTKEAMKYVDKAIEIDKRYADALMNKAVMLYDKGEMEEARKYLARANVCDR
jgi:Tfp pilus assembly protein PilF